MTTYVLFPILLVLDTSKACCFWAASGVKRCATHHATNIERISLRPHIIWTADMYAVGYSIVIDYIQVVDFQ